MPTVNFYDNIQGQANEDGVWSYVIGDNSPNPPAPVTWDADVDYTGFPVGNYTYQYLVKSVDETCEELSLFTLTIADQTTPEGDTCADAIAVWNVTAPDTAHVENDQTFLGSCPGTAAPTLDATAIPAAWGGSTYSGDLWYLVTIAASTGTIMDTFTFRTTVSSSAQANPLIRPSIAFYTTCGGGLLDATAAQNNNQAVLETTAMINSTYLVRVGAIDGNEGNFDIIFELYEN